MKKIIYPNGNIYEGGLKDGEYHGQGTYTFASGAKYEGEHKNSDGLREVWELVKRADVIIQNFRFGVVWLVVMVAVLSAARFKRADYLLPAFPGAAIALGCAAERWLTARANPRSATRAKWAFGVLVACALAVWPVMWIGYE